MLRKYLLPFVLFIFVVCACEKAPEEVRVESVSLSQPTAEMLVGESVQLSATVLPSNATDKTVIWASSKQSVATVTESGRVTAIAEGVSTITASASGKSATCIVTVSKGYVAVSSVTLNKQSLSLEKGASETLSATVLPADATNKTVTWTTSNSSIASIDQGGKVTAIGGGSATITAKADNQTATCTVTVTVPVTSISLDRESLTLEEEGTTVLVATIEPADATDKTITWSSSNTAIVTVDNAGKVTAVKEGSAVITAKAGAKEAKCAVTVQKKIIPVSSITLNKNTLSLIKGASETLFATISPENATDKTVTWSSSNAEVASVDENGNVIANAGGEAIITAKAGEKSATCTVTVTVPVESVTLSKTTIELTEGESETIIATVKPDDATDNKVTWGSSNTGVATVDEEGKVTAIAAGETNIIAMAGGKTAICNVVVKKDTSAEAIVFADSNVKEKLVVAFDTNGDGELSYGEAAAVTDGAKLKSAFGDSASYTSFDEFQYFTGITTLPNGMFQNWILESIVMPSSITTMGRDTFKECAKLNNVILPKSLSFIPFFCFKSCVSLESIVLPESISSIGADAFYGCISLTSIVIPQKVKSIENEAFYGCTQLSSVSLPTELATLAYGAFSRCSSLKTITLPESLNMLDSYMFSGDSSLETVYLPATIKRIKYSAFKNCTSLKNIVLPSSVTEIEYQLFDGCTSLVSVTLSTNLSGKLPSHTFRNCKQLEKIVIPEAITIIEGEAFQNCSALTEITIPENIVQIGDHILSNCTSLQKVLVLPKTVPQCSLSYYSEWRAFYKTTCPIYVPAESVDAYKTAQYWSEYADRIQAIPE